MYSAFLLLCAFGNRIVASSLLSLPQIPTPTNFSSTVGLSNASNVTLPTPENSVLTSMSYDCDKENFGQPTFDSCMDAFAQLPAGSSNVYSYGDRENKQTYDFPLPLRYASADGTCIIEIFPRTEGASDLMKPLILKQAVRYLIQRCVAGENEGGIAEKLGQKGRLAVFVERFQPNVGCLEGEGIPPIYALCQLALNAMPVSDNLEIFGERDTPNIDVALPVRYADLTAKCTIDVMIAGPPVRANWYDLWGAAVMVVAMCARFGRAGVWSGIAGETELAVSVANNAPATLPEATA